MKFIKKIIAFLSTPKEVPPTFTSKFKKGDRVLQVWRENPREKRVIRGTVTEVLSEYNGYAVVWDNILNKEYLEEEGFLTLSSDKEV